nr:MAG TPA: hypothetical protein [Caudoviricetes sp.]
MTAKVYHYSFQFAQVTGGISTTISTTLCA